MVEEKLLKYEGVEYIVSSDGHIYSTSNIGRGKYHKEISQRENSDGYMCITVGKNGKRTTGRVNRMVALAFIPNPNNFPEVNHKDCNRKNNNVDNLEWCTHEYNIEHSAKLGNYKNKCGDKNPNYKNDTLKKRFENDPDLKKIQSRPRGKNGRAVQVEIEDTLTGKVVQFDCMTDAAEYVISNGYTNAKTLYSVSNKISQKAKNKMVFYKCLKARFI